MDDSNRHVSTQGGDFRGALTLGENLRATKASGKKGNDLSVAESDNNATDFILPTTRPTGGEPGCVIPRLSASSTLDQLNVHFCSMF